MDDLSNLIDPDHDLFLKNLRSVSESSDIAEAENTDAALTGHERIDIVTFSHVLGNDTRARLSETDGK